MRSDSLARKVPGHPARWELGGSARGYFPFTSTRTPPSLPRAPPRRGSGSEAISLRLHGVPLRASLPLLDPPARQRELRRHRARRAPGFYKKRAVSGRPASGREAGDRQQIAASLRTKGPSADTVASSGTVARQRNAAAREVKQQGHGGEAPLERCGA